MKSMSKLVNILLIAAIASLVVLLVQARQAGENLEKEYERLAELYGELPVDDEDKFYVVFRGDSARCKFDWRIYNPALKNGMSGGAFSARGWSMSHSGGSQPAGERLAFARFRMSEGKPELFYSLDGSSSVLSITKAMRGFLKDHWNDLDFKVMGEEGAEVAAPENVLSLLTVRIPESLVAELPDDLSSFERQKYLQEPLFELCLGDTFLMEQLH